MTVHEVAALTGVSVRTLHHYDHIGLLSPARREVNGYRFYGQEELDRLQQILFFKACGFPLTNIIGILESPGYHREEAFSLQRKALLHEKKRIEAMLRTLDKTLESWKGECDMSAQEKFQGFDFGKNPYEEEARRLWGDAAVGRSKAHIEAKSKLEQQNLGESMEALFRELARFRDADPASEQTQEVIGRFYAFLNQNMGIHYSYEAFAGLGRLYVTDERFTRNIDRYGDGLSQFLAKAMDVFAAAHQA